MDPECLSRIPDPNFSIPNPGSRAKKAQDPGSGSATKNVRIFNTKIILSFWKYDLGCLSRSGFFPIRDPGSRDQKLDPGSAALITIYNGKLTVSVEHFEGEEKMLPLITV